MADEEKLSEGLYTDDSFRDTLATVDEKGKRIWLFPKMQKGQLFKYRAYVSWFLLAFMVLMPFVKINGHPFFLLNVLERRFIIFGQVFWPQDFHLFGLGMLVFVIFIILFTVVFGRVWCGWACPQTIFMEMIFRRIEYWIEGDAERQKRLMEAPWSAEKLRKRLMKYALFIGVAFVLAHTVLAWIIGVDELWRWITHPPTENPSGFITMMVTTFLIFGIYIRFREQMCTTFCPYGRLQGVLLGEDSMTVAYDYKRGEKRARLKKRMPEDAGDCIDCNLCVKVCPTGIDIRNGTQLECVNCTLCIDACDSIMEKVGKPKKLIGYKSENSIKNRVAFMLSARQKAYSVVLSVLVVVLLSLTFMRSDVEATILRTPGSLFTKNEDGTVSNLYQMQLVNKTFDPIELQVYSDIEGATIRPVGDSLMLRVEESSSLDAMFFVDIAPSQLDGINTKIKLEVRDKEGKVVDKVRTNFVGPIK